MNRKRGNNRIYKTIIVITAVSLGISVFLCGCGEKETTKTTPIPTVTTTAGALPEPTLSPSSGPVETKMPEKDENPVEYEERIFEVNGRENHIFQLLIDISDPTVTVMPYLAFGRIFGFEYLRDMADATGAYAAVNAGFFFEYGRPSGLVVNDGEIISAGTGRFYSLVIEGSEARFEIVKTDISLVIDGESISIQAYNRSPGDAGSAVFSDVYGSTDRLGYYRSVLIIEDGIVRDFWRAESPADIPEGGYVVMLPPDYPFAGSPKGKKASVVFSPSFREGVMAYECASMLVENGVSLAGDTMPWVGNLNHTDPRTCVGILGDGRLGFVVIDGRQTGYSSGTTGRETADILIELGFTDAVMLDGGGSSQMIIEGRTVNSPSSGPEGRPIAGGFMIKIAD